LKIVFFKESKMENLKTWNEMKSPPKSALKEIKGGRSKGMTDINPQWRYETMTRVFGMCGIGWKYVIEKLWNEPTCDNQTFCFALVKVYVKDGEEWSEPIHGVGGNMLVTKENAGLHASDEGYKMAVSDAIGTAMKMLGVGADIYAGKWDGSKYKDAPAPAKIEPPKPVKNKLDDVLRGIEDATEWKVDKMKLQAVLLELPPHKTIPATQRGVDFCVAELIKPEYELKLKDETPY
jgi:hypothetical protein